MDRLEAFETMLRELRQRAEYEKQKMDELKLQGKDKTATYRQYMGNRLLYQQMLALYRQYGLIESEAAAGIHIPPGPYLHSMEM